MTNNLRLTQAKRKLKVNNMCATCGCMKPKDKHGMKTVSAANKKFAGKGKCAKCGKTPCACKKAPAKKTAPKKK